MSYIKQNFNNGKILKADNLNAIEDGIVAVHDMIGDIDTILDSIIALQESLIGGNIDDDNSGKA